MDFTEMKKKTKELASDIVDARRAREARARESGPDADRMDDSSGRADHGDGSGRDQRTATPDPASSGDPTADERRRDPVDDGGTRGDSRPVYADVASEGREPLVPADRADSYGSRWNAVKGAFVDEPRQAVAQADALVVELLEELEQLFREQRRSIERGLDTDGASTEDLRLALRRYRSFFDRLLSL